MMFISNNQIKNSGNGCNLLSKKSSVFIKLHFMRPVLLVVLSVFLFAFSCENKDDGRLPEKEIVGQWKWEYSVYSNTQSGEPYILTPDTLGFNTVYYFDMDGNFRVLRNTFTEGKGIYWFELAEKENDEDGLLLYTQQDEFIRSVDFYISGDTLILDETLSKGPKRYFLRTGEL